MVTGIIGRKVGMTQIFDADGTVHPATVIKAGPCVVVQAKDAQKDGYEAVQLGFVEETPAKSNRPTAGLQRAAIEPYNEPRCSLRESRMSVRKMTNDSERARSIQAERLQYLHCGRVLPSAFATQA